MIENFREGPERAVLAAVDAGEYDIDISLEELSELARAADIEVMGSIVQRKADPDPATCIGSGRLQELADFVKTWECDMVIFDCELSPAQLRNIENVCQCQVIDRTTLILDIFARRAVSAEGKLQAQLASLRYKLPRLAGQGTALSRQGGGGGGGAGARRGAGESKLETDRRHIRRRITALEKELEELSLRRERVRTRRKKERVLTAAIVGYTNVGKSTLLNALTDAGVLAKDMLFATLDPTARALKLPDGRNIMLIDTVGLVRRLPHHLVEAFKSTLEDAANADLIFNVCDASSGELEDQLTVTMDLLEELGAKGTPVITVLNKCDKAPEDAGMGIPGAVRISAKTGEGLEELLHAAALALPSLRSRIKLLIPYSQGEIENAVASRGIVHSRDYTPEGIMIEASADSELLREISSFIVKTQEKPLLSRRDEGTV